MPSLLQLPGEVRMIGKRASECHRVEAAVWLMAQLAADYGKDRVRFVIWLDNDVSVQVLKTAVK